MTDENYSDDPEQTQAERSIAAMLDINWNTNWSTLPIEAEQHVEQAYIHLAEARDIVDDDRTHDGGPDSPGGGR